MLGAFWGVWSAAIPSVRDHAHVSDGQFGFALLALGAGSLPAMVGMGRVVDKHGRLATNVTLGLLAATGAAVAFFGSSVLNLTVGLMLLGAFSGAANVGTNAAAVRAQQLSGVPVVARAHGFFSITLVAAILATAELRSAGISSFLPFLALTTVAVIYASVASHPPPGRQLSRTTTVTGDPRDTRRFLILVGCMGAMAFVMESTHQAWTATFLRDRLGIGESTALLAPSIFYVTAAVSRIGLGLLPIRRHERIVAGGAVLAAAGTVLVALAHAITFAFVGVVVAAAGTAVLFPTLLSVAAEHSGSSTTGLITSKVTAISYLGFVFGPAYVGFWAATLDLQSAFLAVAALSLPLVLLIHRWPSAEPDPSGTMPCTQSGT